MATARQSKTRAQRIKDRAVQRRQELWPEIPTEKNWNRKGSYGFSTVPRTLALVGMIADTLAEKNKRVSSTYWGLWCRVWDTGVVIIENEYELATEAGFSGERRVYTWRDRIKQLVMLRLIEVKEGPEGAVPVRADLQPIPRPVRPSKRRPDSGAGVADVRPSAPRRSRPRICSDTRPAWAAERRTMREGSKGWYRGDVWSRNEHAERGVSTDPANRVSASKGFARGGC